MKGKNKKNGMFAKIETREDALKTIKDCSFGFFFVAVLQGVLGYFIAPSIIFDAILYAVFAGILLKWKSRIAAVVLLFLSCAAIIMTVLNRFGVTAEGGNNIFLAVIIFWAAIRSVEATFKLYGKFTTESI
ncbi:MAG: hypothetical protein KJ882_03935 [Proteobacteria bacterium]|nr:hypothetical protein [Pseudomonadota bacterium]MBU4009893.1 hypothetical protein [Pseudomonadota bacterium]